MYWEISGTWIWSHWFKLGGCFAGEFLPGLLPDTIYVETCHYCYLSIFLWVEFLSPRAPASVVPRVLCLFDSHPRELVQHPNNIVSLEFLTIRSSTASVSTANPELGEWDIGRYALSRREDFWWADQTRILGKPPEFTKAILFSQYKL